MFYEYFILVRSHEVMNKFKLVVSLALLGLASCSLWAGGGLKGTGYPHHDVMFHHQHEDSRELCNALRRHIDVLLRSNIFRCERLPGNATGKVSR